MSKKQENNFNDIGKPDFQDISGKRLVLEIIFWFAVVVVFVCAASWVEAIGCFNPDNQCIDIIAKELGLS